MKTEAKKYTASLTIQQLCEGFMLTETHPASLGVIATRGWIMDEMESRDPEAVYAWVESGETDPTPYFGDT